MKELMQGMKESLAMLRFSDLKRLEIVRNRVTLSRWIDKSGFPAPIRLGPNSIAWRAVDIKKWLKERASAPGPTEVA